MKDAMRWWAVHAVQWGVLYGAFAVQSEGAMHVLTFWVWVMAVMCPLMLTDAAIADGAKKQDRPMLRRLRWAWAWVTLVLLTWFGHFATGLAWLWVMLVLTIYEDKVKAQRNALAQKLRLLWTST